MQMVNKVEVLRAMLFTTDDFKTILNQVDFPQYNIFDLEFMIEFKKIFEFGEPQLRKFITKLDTEGVYLDTYSIHYYTHILKAGPFGNMVRDIIGDPNQHPYWKDLPDSVGGNADNFHTSANTAGYTDSPQIDIAPQNIFSNMPNTMRVTSARGLSSTNNVYFSGVASSTTVDSTFATVANQSTAKTKAQETYEKAQDGTLQQTSHGGYWVTDVQFLKIIQQTTTSITEVVNGSFTPEEQRRLYNQNGEGYFANLFTTAPPKAIPVAEVPPKAIPVQQSDILTTSPNPAQSQFDSIGFSVDGIATTAPPTQNTSTTAVSTTQFLSINPLFVNVENPTITIPVNSAPTPSAPPAPPAGQEYLPTANNQDNISKIFKIQKEVTDNNVKRMIELDLYGNEFDSKPRRERLLKIGGKEYSKNLNLNTNVGQLGNIGDSDSTELTQTTMAPFNRGPQAAGLYPSQPFASGGVSSPPQDTAPIDVPRVPIGSVDLAARKSFLSGLPEGHKNQNGLITITSYGQGDDPYGDSGTRKRCGFADNLISEGSVALSPAFVRKFKPARGQLVIINGVAIGYYDDHAPDRFQSKSGAWVYYGWVIDVYDPFSQLGPISKNGGQSFNVSFGDVRQHVHNPNCKNIG